MTQLLASSEDVEPETPAAGSPADSADSAGLTVPTGRRLGRAGLEILVGGVLAALLSMALQFVISRAHASRPTFVPNDAIALGVSALVIVGLALAGWSLVSARWPRWASPLCWGVLAATPTIALSFMLLGTRLYLGGLSVDQTFRTEYLTRLASSPSLADFTYRGVAPFYPAAWFWLGGRFADIIGQPAWAAFKPWAILTLAVTAVVVFALWSLVVRRPTAFLLALLTSVIGLTYGADEPYSWLITATIPPLAVLAWRWLGQLTTQRSPHGGPRGGRGVVVTLGLAMGVYGVLYTLYLLFFALLLVLFGALAIVLAARRRAEGDPSARDMIRRVVARLVVAGLVAVPVLLTVWTPYLLAVLSGQRTNSAAQHFLPLSGATLPTPMLELSVTGALCLLGTGWIVLNARRNPVAAALGGVVGIGYLWYLLSFALLAFQTTLLAFRIYNILVVALAGAGLLGAVDLARWMSRRWLARRRGEVRVLGLAVGFAVLLSLVQSAPGVANPDPAAFHDYYPTGVTALGHASPADEDYWVPQLDSTIRQMTGRQPRQLVVLSDQALLVSTTPYWLFQARTKHYADPLGDYDQRNALIAGWAKAGSAPALLSELDASPATPPTVFVFLHKPAGLVITTTRDVFPAQPNVETDTVVFRPALFHDPRFTSRTVGPYTVIVRTG
jgi:galactan 5-O-arabinofuranosyltransferase